MSIDRRRFLLGMLALGAAPAIVRAESIMRVRPIIPPSVCLAEIGHYESFRFIESPHVDVSAESIRAACDKLREAAIKPVRIDGEDSWIVIVHPDRTEEVYEALRGRPWGANRAPIPKPKPSRLLNGMLLRVPA